MMKQQHYDNLSVEVKRAVSSAKSIPRQRQPAASDYSRKEWHPVDESLGRPEVEAEVFFALYVRGLSNGIPSYSLDQLIEDISPGRDSSVAMRNFRLEVLERFQEMVWASQRKAGAA